MMTRTGNRATTLAYIMGHATHLEVFWLDT